MERVRIDTGKRCFTQGGRPFFYQADTLWMAFSKLSMAEWDEVLSMRRAQRYTVLQISVLPISHDNSEDDGALMPFARQPDGGWDFAVLNEAYFDHAVAMLERAAEMDFVPCLHLLWANYVPDTWAAKRSPATVMPPEAVRAYLQAILPRVRAFAPIYSVSGDTAFETERVTATYLEAMRIVRTIDPDRLITLHLQPDADVPGALCESGMLDFYSYQAGHGHSERDLGNSVTFAKHYWAKPGAKPVVNTEPPYEGHGFGHAYGRFGAFDIRRAIWQSLLSGAQAGIAYGAHGLWSFHRAGQPFNNVSFSGMPFDWRTALRFEGAWEPGYARTLYEQYDLFGLTPLDGVQTQPDEIRLAGTPDGRVLLLYVPYPTDVSLSRDLSAYDWLAINLRTKQTMQAEALHTRAGTTLVMPQANADILYIATQRHSQPERSNQ